MHLSCPLRRALRPIAPGEEVTISYVELCATAQERRELLSDTYLFDVAAAGNTGHVRGTQAAAAAADAFSAAAAAGAGAAGAGGASSMVVDAEGAGEEGAESVAPDVGASGSGQPQELRPRPPPLFSMELEPGATLHVYRGQGQRQGQGQGQGQQGHSQGRADETGTAEQGTALPPWPTDPWDVHLAEVVPAGGCRTTGLGQGRTTGRGQLGGLWARVVPRRPFEPQEEDDDSEDDDDEEAEAGGAVSMETEQAEMGGGSGSGTGVGGAGTRQQGRGVGEARKLVLQLPGVGGGRGGGGAGCRGEARRGGAAGAGAVGSIEVLAWGPWVEPLVRAWEVRTGGVTAAAGEAGLQRGLGDGGEASEGLRRGGGGAGAGLGMGAEEAGEVTAAAGLLRRCVGALRAQAQAEAASGDQQYGQVGTACGAPRLGHRVCGSISAGLLVQPVVGTEEHAVVVGGFPRFPLPCTAPVRHPRLHPRDGRRTSRAQAMGHS